MDPGQISSHSISGLKDSKTITEGGVSYHSVEIMIENVSGYRQDILCVKEMSVEILFEHSCIEQIGYIALQRGPTSDSNTKNFEDEAKVCETS